VVKTVDGGDIDMLAPYGSINAGATFRAIEKKSDQLGVIAGRGGDINIFLDGDLQVNRERVFALQGDLLAWSSNGSIDAGKGAKTVVSVPDPIVTTDANGNTIVTFPPAVDGSGLSASGNAYLFAPHGVINAGDAGIRVQGNLIIGARQVLGAENINVGGAAVGVPTAPPAVSVGMVDAGALSSSAASLAEAATSNSIRESSDSEGAGETLGMLSVQVLGFGDSDAGGSSTGEEDKGP
jgi:filamentous hemagglutinin